MSVVFIPTSSPLTFMPTFIIIIRKIAHTDLVGVLEGFFLKTEMSLRSGQ